MIMCSEKEKILMDNSSFVSQWLMVKELAPAVKRRNLDAAE